MIGIPVGLLYANAAEWVMHRYVLHGLGKRRESFWSFHWHDHHGTVRRNDHVDAGYAKPLWEAPSQTKEVAALAATALAVLPLAPVAPWFTATVIASGVHYWRVHKRSHLDPEWAREHLPWHYDHHMGPNQDANWCVTHPFFDHLMGTREPYVGTEREAQDRAKRARLRARKAAASAVAPADAASADAAPAPAA